MKNRQHSDSLCPDHQISFSTTPAHQCQPIAYEEYQLAEALRTSLKAIASSLDFDTVMMQLLDSVKQVVPNDQSNAMLIDGKIGRVAYCSFCREGKLHAPHTHEFSLDIVTLKSMFTTKEPCLIADTRHSSGWLYIEEEKNVLSYLGVPIQIDDEVIGFLNLNSFKPNAFNKTHAEHLKLFASQAAIAVKNARLYEKTQHYAVELEAEVEKRTEELLRAGEHAAAMLKCSSDSIVVANPDGYIVQANPAFNYQFLYEVDECIGKHLTDLVHSEHKETFTEIMDQLLIERKAHRLEVSMQDKRGLTFEADVVLSPVSNGHGVITEVLCSLRDVSQKKALMNKLLENLEKEQHLNELKSRCVAIASHDLRNPLTAMLSSIGLLRQYRSRLSEDEINQKYESMIDQIAYMNELLEDILVMGQMESDQIHLNLEPVDIGHLCGEIIELFQLAHGQTHQIHFTAQSACTVINVDRRLIHQAIDNLITNAIKYSPNGTPVDIVLACGEKMLTLSIRDHGIGIPELDQAKIFDVFQRASNVGSIKGTGLGLAITKRAIELHDGTLYMTSQPGQGTTFTLNLPRDLS